MKDRNMTVMPLFSMIDSLLRNRDLPNNESFIPVKNIKFEVKETSNQYLVSLDLPGVKKEEIHVEVDKDFIRVAVERKQENCSENEKLIHSERYYGKLERVLKFGQQLDESNVIAKYSDGVLSITLNKKQAESVKKILID